MKNQEAQMSMDFRFLGLLDSYPFKLTEDEKRELAGFDLEIARLQGQKILKLRELARQKGKSALKLEDLKSECSKPFVEEAGRRNYQRAIATDEKRPHHYEFAYLCASRFDTRSENNTCGWVRGEPREERYDNIGPLCGSAGRRFYCTICGKMVGELQERVS